MHFRLRLITPVIRLHGVDYEQGKLKAKLDSGNITTVKTDVRLFTENFTYFLQ